MEEGCLKEAAVPLESFDKIQLKQLSIPLLKLRVTGEGKKQKLQIEDDEYLYCDECKELHVGECPTHGPFTWVKDNVGTKDNCKGYTGSELCSDSADVFDVKDTRKPNMDALDGADSKTCMDTEESTNQTCPPYDSNLNKPHSVATDVAGEMKPAVSNQTKARQSFPVGLEARVSSIPDAGLGVFALQRFGRKVVLGPYGGKKLQIGDILPTTDQSYMWDVIEGGKVSHVVDANDEEESNWMRFVNCARHEGEQNLVAFQYRGKIYYRTYKTIEPGQELLVWYGDEYACHLDILQDGASKTGSTVSCPKCCIVFNGPSFLARHTKFRCQINNKGFPYRCVHCGKGFKDKAYYQIHKNIHTGVKPYSCTFCSMRFCDPSSRRKHVIRHRGGKPYRCKKCGKCFAWYKSLNSHMKSLHSTAKAFKCRHCPAKFTFAHSVRRHEQLHVCGKLTHKCSKCRVMFQSKCSLTKHQNIHLLGKKNNHCSTCNANFSSKVGLANHMRIHRGSLLKSSTDKGLLSVASFKCAHCGKCFHSKRALKIHKWMHDGEKSPSYAPKDKAKLFRCKKCGKTFSSQSSLGSHKATHYVPDVYRCPVCPTIFLQKHKMFKHLSSHPGKNYKCALCEKRFRNDKDLSEHSRLHRGQPRTKTTFKESIDPKVLKNLSFICGKCGSSFHTYLSLIRHKKCHAGKEDTPSAGDTVHIPGSELSNNIQDCIVGKGPVQVKREVDDSSRDGQCKTGHDEEVGWADGDANLHDPEKADVILSGEFPNRGGKEVEEKPFKCFRCRKYFQSEPSLRCHMAVHRRKRVGMIKRSRGSISMPPTERKLRHSLAPNSSALPNKPVPVDIIDDPSSSGQTCAGTSFRRDKKQNNEFYKPFKCTRCRKQFATYFSLRRHKLLHARFGLKAQVKLDRLQGGVTDKVGPSSYEIKRLPGQTPGADNRPSVFPHQKKFLKCSTSGKDSLPNFEHGDRTKRAFKCTECNNHYKSAKSLANHKRVHTTGTRERAELSKKKENESDYPQGCSCDVCGKRFSCSQHMVNHRIHHFSRSYKCPICSKVLLTLTKLRLHLRQHPGNHFTCLICRKGFKIHRTLRAHLKFTHNTIESSISNGGRIESGKIKVNSRQVPTCKQEESFAKSKCNAVSSSQSLASGGVKDKEVKCQHCDKVFGTSRSLGQHNRVHAVKTNLPVTRQVEQLEVGNNSSVGRVTKLKSKCSEHNGKDGSCRENTVSAQQEESFVNSKCNAMSSGHSLASGGVKDKEVKCQHCDKVFGTRRSLGQHNRVHAAKTNLPATRQVEQLEVGNNSSVARVTKLKSKFSEHNGKDGSCRENTVSAQQEESFANSKCNAVSSGQSLVSGGVKEDDKEVKCQHCDKVFGTRRSLGQHNRVHALTTNLPPTLHVEHLKVGNNSTAARVTKPKSKFGEHNGKVGSCRENTVSAQKSSTYKCASCGRKFSSYINYCSHLPLHVGQDSAGSNTGSQASKRSSCKFCRRHFKNPQVLQDHVKTFHAKRNPRSCEVCLKMFSNSANVVRHMATAHTDVRPYSCNMCDTTFKRKDALKRHLHTQHKPGTAK